MVEFLIKKSNGTEKTKRREIITKKKREKKNYISTRIREKKNQPGAGKGQC